MTLRLVDGICKIRFFLQNSPYTYCYNNPLVYVDPNGEWFFQIIGAIIGGIYGYKEGGWKGAIFGALTGAILGEVASHITTTSLIEAGKAGLQAAGRDVATQVLLTGKVDPKQTL